MPRFCVFQEASNHNLYAVIDRRRSTTVRRYYLARFVTFTQAQEMVREAEAQFHTQGTTP